MELIKKKLIVFLRPVVEVLPRPGPGGLPHPRAPPQLPGKMSSCLRGSGAGMGQRQKVWVAYCILARMVCKNIVYYYDSYYCYSHCVLCSYKFILQNPLHDLYQSFAW